MTQSERQFRAERIAKALGRYGPPDLSDRLANGWPGRLDHEQKVKKLAGELRARGFCYADHERLARQILRSVGIAPPDPAGGAPAGTSKAVPSRRDKMLRVLYPHVRHKGR